MVGQFAANNNFPLILSLSKDPLAPMPFYVYILICADGSYYTGHTDQIEARLAAHQAGQFSGYTSEHRPVELAILEELGSRDEAFRRERQGQGMVPC